ncbi:MAG: DNA translocase FtsK 4TM domain-containing protein [Myxococcaceae bacterium]
MAARKARQDKSVLSRQDIVSRRKALTEKKLQSSGVGRRAIFGTFLVAFSVLLLLSLATFDVHDRVGPGFRNAIGPVGHLLAETFRGMLGLCAYVLPAVGIYVAAILFVGSGEKRRWPQWLSFLLLTLSTAVLAHVGFGQEPGWVHPPGGAVGSYLGNLLTGLFGTVGTVILVTAVCVAALIVGTQFVFLKLCAIAWHGMVVAAEATRTWLAAFLVNQKAALEKRREESLKAKEEEAAFLAQLEADEEDLVAAQAELEVAEAEAMAEEATRLAKEAVERAKTDARVQKEAEKAMREAEKAARLAKRTQPVVSSGDVVAAAAAASMPVPAPAPFVARPRAGEDPAWAASLAPIAPPPVEAAPEVAEPPRKKERKLPNIVTGPAAQSQALVTAASAEPNAPVVETASLVAATAAATAVAPVAVPPAGATAVGAQLARMPLIVEPKAPPKPVKAPKKEQEQFEFIGGRKSFSLPPLDVLSAEKRERSALDKEAFLSTAEKLRAKLADFGILGEVVEIRPGPVVTMYEFLPGPGIKVSKIASLADDLAMAMEAMRVRIVAPIPGKGVVGIEVPNKDRETVFLKEIAEQDTFQKAGSKLTMCVGKDIEGMPYVLDLAKAPHILIAGTTGSGKSVAVNSMIMSILLKATPEEVRFIMVDPKMLELSVYEGIPHLLLPVVTDPKKAALALRWAVEEMERRYQLLSEAGVRNIAGYNKHVEALTEKDKGVIKPPASLGVPGVIDGKVLAKTEAAPPPPPPKKKGKLLIVDVAEGESSDDALLRAKSAENQVGVPAPKEELEDVREKVEAAEETPPASEPLPELPPTAEENRALAEAAEAVASGEAPVEEKKELKKLPYIVVIIDELADLMMVASREVETYIARLAQMARAAGIHLMVATQRPSTDVVTGVIKANFPTRISFMLRSKPDSMTILGTIGSEALLGMGDMLIMPPTSAHLQRVHGAYVSENEIKAAVDHLKAQGKPVFDESILKPREEESEGGGGEEDELSDELYDQALATVSEMEKVSISMLQRKMRIGYNRAARMIERMERDGVVGPADGAKPRDVLIRGVGEMPGAGAM